MKKYNIFGKWVFVLLLTAGLGGCIRDDASADSNKTVDMALSLDTYAGNTDPNASANETAVKSAWVYIFNENGALENPGQTSVPLTPSGEATDASDRLNRTWRVTVGRKDIYVLLNAGHILRNNTAVDLATYNPYSKAELETLMTDPANFAADFPAAGSTGMLMSGKRDVMVSTSMSVVTVPVARRYARIDLQLRRKAELAGATVVAKNTTLKNRREMAHAFAPVTESTGADIVYLNNHGDVTIGASTTDYTAVTSFYTLPRTGAAKAACLDVAFSIDGKDYTLPVYINSGALGGSSANNENLPLDITANKIYKVNVTLSRQDFTISMNILEWDEEEVNGDIQGSSLVLDSVVFARAGRETLIPVLSKADRIQAKLSDAAVTAGYTLTGAEADGILEIAVTDGKAEIPVTGPAAYPVGTEYNIAVSAGNIRRNALLRVDGTPILEVADEVITFGHEGGTEPYLVTSYIDLGDDADTKVPVTWTAEFSTNGGQTWTTSKPAWLREFTSTDAGSIAPASFNARMLMVSGTTYPASRTALQSATPANNLDLSMVNGSRTTANCYLVNASGTYTLPLVYGNAFKGGGPNSPAYTSTKTGTNILTTFINHLGNEISDPYIYNNTDCAPYDACLVWQDAEGLVQNAALTADKMNISFSVPHSTIQQGNAVIAVRDASGVIMWSWHIWVTDYVLGTDVKLVTNFQSETYDVMPLNLGWCDGTTTVYGSRNLVVRLTQPATGLSTTFTLDQPSETVVGPGNNPYYQWGRKDPTIPGIFNAAGTSGTDKSCYTDSDKPEYAYNKKGINTDVISEYIKNPHCYNINYYMDKKYYNLWSANNSTTTANDNPVVKTVYDPSPAGYCLPPSNAFTGFVYNGTGASGIGDACFGTRYNSPYLSAAEYNTNYGLLFYCNKMNEEGVFDPNGGTIFFPAMGFRMNSSGTLSVYGTNGYYWTAIPKTVNNSYAVNISTSQVSTVNNGNRASGYSVRPIREQ